MIMTLAKDDLLLKLGKVIALVLQALCVLGGGVFFLLIVVVTLMSEGMLPGLADAESLPDAAKYPLLTAFIGLTVMANFAVMFFFFGKMRALIESASKGDPFIPDNARRLNAMAWLLLSSQVLTVIVGELRVFAFSLIDPQSQNTFDIRPNDLAGFLIVLVLFILARVFRHGAAMREDLEGTV
ncbi:DUF2975 domain-containing protein [Erythrobacter sp. NFXS35]|uniref:DUF2975 domain-containing protein n=1 Tax=Erythrobacter sp. NFXS35 TaxID=2818436 RepID=UPI0032DE9B9A